jgi:hypothetical protein
MYYIEVVGPDRYRFYAGANIFVPTASGVKNSG